MKEPCDPDCIPWDAGEYEGERWECDACGLVLYWEVDEGDEVDAGWWG